MNVYFHRLIRGQSRLHLSLDRSGDVGLFVVHAAWWTVSVYWTLHEVACPTVGERGVW